MKNETLVLAKALIARPSITPADEGCKQLIIHRLTPLGFSSEVFACGDVTNLLILHGTGRATPGSGRRRRNTAAALKRPVIEKILTHLGLDPQPPPRGPAREIGQH